MLSSLLRVEFLKEGRSIRLPILLIFYNSILAFVTILFIFFHNESMQVGYYSGNSSFLKQFLVISSFQIVTVFFMMPFSVSSLEENEREISKQFSQIPGVTKHYMIAKICILTALNLLLFVSSLPIISLSCIYSGISLLKMVRLFGMVLVFSIWSGSIALFCSSINRKAIFAFSGTIFIYVMFSVGIILFLEIVRAIGTSVGGQPGTSMGMKYLCVFINLFNPLMAYAGYYGNITGNAGLINSYFGNFGIDATTTLFSFLYYKAALLGCLAMGALFLYLSIRFYNHDQ